jgi:hypothetical protein
MREEAGRRDASMSESLVNGELVNERTFPRKPRKTGQNRDYYYSYHFKRDRELVGSFLVLRVGPMLKHSGRH